MRKLTIKVGQTIRPVIIFQGDSGGPLVVQNEEDGRYTQVGIVSFGLGACDVTKTSPVAFSRVSEFLQFVSLASSDMWGNLN